MDKARLEIGSVPVRIAARVYGRDPAWVRAGIIAGWLPIGEATRNGKRVTDIQQMNSKLGRISYNRWVASCESAERTYLWMLGDGYRPEQARCVLPLCLKTDIVVTANYREWRNIFKLRTPVAAHPQMRELMCPLLKELQSKIPVVFDNIYTYWPEDDQTGKGSMVK